MAPAPLELVAVLGRAFAGRAAYRGGNVAEAKSSRSPPDPAWKGGGCGGYTYELSYAEMPDLTDVVYKNILAVDNYSWSYLKDATLEWQVEGLQEEFVVQNKEIETGRCGCGESFYIQD